MCQNFEVDFFWRGGSGWVAVTEWCFWDRWKEEIKAVRMIPKSWNMDVFCLINSQMPCFQLTIFLLNTPEMSISMVKNTQNVDFYGKKHPKHQFQW